MRHRPRAAFLALAAVSVLGLSGCSAIADADPGTGSLGGAPGHPRTGIRCGTGVGEARHPGGQGTRPQDRIHARTVRPVVVRRQQRRGRPQRLRHPQRHPPPRPGRPDLQDQYPGLCGGDRNPARHLRRHHHRVRSRPGHLHRGADRPRRRPVGCVAEGCPAAQPGAAPRPRQRPPGTCRPSTAPRTRRSPIPTPHRGCRRTRHTGAPTSRGRSTSKPSTGCG